MPDCTGWETPIETDTILLPSKLEKDTEGAWRMDLAVDIDIDGEGRYDDEGNGKIDEYESHVETSDCETDSSMSISSDTWSQIP